MMRILPDWFFSVVALLGLICTLVGGGMMVHDREDEIKRSESANMSLQAQVVNAEDEVMMVLDTQMESCALSTANMPECVEALNSCEYDKATILSIVERFCQCDKFINEWAEEE